MSRLAATLRCDARLQLRNGFYYAGGFVAVAAVLLLRWLDPPGLARLLPALVLSNLLINTFYFMGGLVLLEKGEGTLEAQVVTPLRLWEYLGSKVITLCGLSLAENLAIVAATHGAGFAVLPLAAGVAGAAALFSLAGFVVVSRYDSINEYLFPSFLVTSLLPLPLLDSFGAWPSRLFDLHPAQGPLRLMASAFAPGPGALWSGPGEQAGDGPGRWLLALLAWGLWLAAAWIASGRAFERFVRAAARTA